MARKMKHEAKASALPREHFLNRELQALEFNRRVLAQAEDKATPLLERLKFLAIFASNLDEFFMVRVGGLQQKVSAGIPVGSGADRMGGIIDFETRFPSAIEAAMAG